jgi:hypothetical protein
MTARREPRTHDQSVKSARASWGQPSRATAYDGVEFQAGVDAHELEDERDGGADEPRRRDVRDHAEDALQDATGAGEASQASGPHAGGGEEEEAACPSIAGRLGEDERRESRGAHREGEVGVEGREECVADSSRLVGHGGAHGGSCE